MKFAINEQKSADVMATLPPNQSAQIFLAGRLRRLLAFLLDCLVLFMIWLPLHFLGRIGPREMLPLYVLGCMYGILLECSRYRASLGGLACKLKAIYPEKHAIPLAILRNMLKYSFLGIGSVVPMHGAIVFFLVMLFPMVMREKQTLYDMISRCIILNRRSMIQRVPICPVKRKRELNQKGIQCEAGVFAGTFFPFTDHNIILGRNPQDCNIVFPPNERGVSDTHCMLICDSNNDRLVIKDMSSSFGTLLYNDNLLMNKDMAVLHRGDWFKVGENNLFTVCL